MRRVVWPSSGKVGEYWGDGGRRLPVWLGWYCIVGFSATGCLIRNTQSFRFFVFLPSPPSSSPLSSLKTFKVNIA
ncbi:hypothetical protein GALMADRAFT_559107 [Galerina marginata CBS 339.88]|uniref:Uncharacterized protein n=1 Tax=Galerina marginata (strain CBS 339.88) TaxID=685588 RepID=A0A067SUR9_GALM3|nr:hypothetical protein GALMADRAFT_559107 [Galerina marginata CBS 339.88]